MDASFDYSQWSDAELARAEHTAQKFLNENQRHIARLLLRQRSLIDQLMIMLQRSGISLEERLDCFARIAETAETMRETANAFFELGAQPVVARVVENATA
jgi:hypothetical protein